MDPENAETPSGETPPAAPDTSGLVSALAKERAARQAAEKALKERQSAEAQAAREAETAEVGKVRTELEARLAAAEAQLSTALAGRTLDAARLSATTAGVDPAHVDTFLRLVDLTGVKVTPEGAVDAEAVGLAITAGLESAPMFKPPLSGAQVGARRANPGSGAGATPAPVGDMTAKVAAQVAAMQRVLGQAPAPA